MRRARDRAIGIGIAPVGAVALLPHPDVRRRVLRRVGHVGLVALAFVAGRIAWIEGRARAVQSWFWGRQGGPRLPMTRRRSVRQTVFRSEGIDPLPAEHVRR